MDIEQLLRTWAPNLYAYRDRFLTSLSATGEMFLKAGLIAFVVGMLFGIILVVTRRGGIRENLLLYQAANLVVNVFRSIPFIILLIFLIPLTRKVVGTAISLIGLTTMAGAVGAGGIGSFAINYGQNQKHQDIVNVCVVVLLVLVFLLQSLGNLLAKRTTNRGLITRKHRRDGGVKERKA